MLKRIGGQASGSSPFPRQTLPGDPPHMLRMNCKRCQRALNWGPRRSEYVYLSLKEAVCQECFNKEEGRE